MSCKLSLSTFNFQLSTLLFFAMSLAGCVDEKPEAKHLPLGTAMPGFSVTGPSEESLTAGDFDGKRAVIVLFRTTCRDCRRELPKVEAAFKAVGGEEDILFAAISKEAPEVVADYWTLAGFTMPYYIDRNGTAFTAFAVKYVPTLYLFGSDGKAAYAAVEDAEKIMDEIDKLQ